MNINQIKLNAAQTNGGSEVFILNDVKKNMKFEDGKPTNEQSGWKYLVVAPKNGFEKFWVKVESKKALITIEDFERISQNGTVWVTFTEDFEAKLYRDNTGNISVTAKASQIEIVEDGEI